MRSHLARIALAGLSCILSNPWPAASEGSPWQILESLRQTLEARAQRASFVQHYLPAGFSTGDSETGELFLALPDCVRWDYLPPNSKSYLLCETTVYTWVPGDPAGRRFELEDAGEPGIDLLRLQLERLESRYSSSIEAGDPAKTVILLVPKSVNHPLRQARLVIDTERQQLTGLEYKDREGNVSRFEVGDYRPLTDASVFTPPNEIEWLDQ